MTMLQREPDRTVDLKLVPNTGGRSAEIRKRRRIDVNEFPENKGVYVIRYRDKQIPRLRGMSPIIRIGQAAAAEGFKKRFVEYNSQQDITTSGLSLFDLLEQRSQKTNVYLMYFLTHWAEYSEIVVDLYFADTGQTQLERTLLRDYLEQHHEYPPLNSGRG